MRFLDLKPKALIRREAARWLARLQGSPSKSTKESFANWYNRHPSHARMFDRIRDQYENQFGLLRNSTLPRAGSLEAVEADVPPSRRFALAAGIAIALILPAAVLFMDRQWGQSSMEAVMLVTKTGEIRRFALKDGSKITLDSESAIRIELGEGRREARLERGRARFEIADGPVFKVNLDSLTAESERGVIDAVHESSFTGIEVLDGDVKLAGSTDEEPALLRTGQGYSETPEGHRVFAIPVEGPDWTSGVLQFDGAPLLQVVALANRYSARKILLVDPDLADLRLTGVFRAGDTAGLAMSIAKAFDLEVAPSTGGDLALRKHVQGRLNKQLEKIP